MPALFLLYESASGYALLEAHGLDAIGGSTPAVQESVTDLDRFGKVSFCFVLNLSTEERDAVGSCPRLFFSFSSRWLAHFPPGCRYLTSRWELCDVFFVLKERKRVQRLLNASRQTTLRNEAFHKS